MAVLLKNITYKHVKNVLTNNTTSIVKQQLTVMNQLIFSLYLPCIKYILKYTLYIYILGGGQRQRGWGGMKTFLFKGGGMTKQLRTAAFRPLVWWCTTEIFKIKYLLSSITGSKHWPKPYTLTTLTTTTTQEQSVGIFLSQNIERRRNYQVYLSNSCSDPLHLLKHMFGCLESFWF